MAEDTAPLVTSNEGLGSIRVAGMSGGLIGGIADMLGRKNFSKGVKVEVGEQEAAVDLSIVVTYGVDIRHVATDVQKNVRRAIESMTGLKVVETNVHVQGVVFPEEEKEEPAARVR